MDLRVFVSDSQPPWGLTQVTPELRDRVPCLACLNHTALESIRNGVRVTRVCHEEIIIERFRQWAMVTMDLWLAIVIRTHLHFSHLVADARRVDW